MFFLFTVADDEKAIEKIYRQYKPLMYTIAYNIIKDTYYAEDIVQIAMQKISSNIRKIDLLIEKRTKSYIFTITRNTALSFYERTKKYNDNTLLILQRTLPAYLRQKQKLILKPLPIFTVSVRKHRSF